MHEVPLNIKSNSINYERLDRRSTSNTAILAVYRLFTCSELGVYSSQTMHVSLGTKQLAPHTHIPSVSTKNCVRVREHCIKTLIRDRI